MTCSFLGTFSAQKKCIHSIYLATSSPLRWNMIKVYTSNVSICFCYIFTSPSSRTMEEVKDCKPTSVPFQHLPFHMRCSGNADYLRFTRPLSPWTCLQGWHLGCCFHDPMHVLFLGTCRDLYGSALGYWLRNDYYGEGSMAAKLRQFSYDLKSQSRAAEFRGVCFNHCF